MSSGDSCAVPGDATRVRPSAAQLLTLEDPYPVGSSQLVGPSAILGGSILATGLGAPSSLFALHQFDATTGAWIKAYQDDKKKRLPAP